MVMQQRKNGEIIDDQMNLQQGIEKFGDQPLEAMTKELMQLQFCSNF